MFGSYLVRTIEKRREEMKTKKHEKKKVPEEKEPPIEDKNETMEQPPSEPKETDNSSIGTSPVKKVKTTPYDYQLLSFYVYDMDVSWKRNFSTGKAKLNRAQRIEVMHYTGGRDKKVALGSLNCREFIDEVVKCVNRNRRKGGADTYSEIKSYEDDVYLLVDEEKKMGFFRDRIRPERTMAWFANKSPLLQKCIEEKESKALFLYNKIETAVKKGGPFNHRPIFMRYVTGEDDAQIRKMWFFKCSCDSNVGHNSVDLRRLAADKIKPFLRKSKREAGSKDYRNIRLSITISWDVGEETTDRSYVIQETRQRTFREFCLWYKEYYPSYWTERYVESTEVPIFDIHVLSWVGNSSESTPCMTPLK